MSILKDVFAELFSMFVGDARLTVAVLVVVGGAAALIDLGGFRPLIGGGVLLVGCLVVLAGTVARAASRQKAAEPSRTA